MSTLKRSMFISSKAGDQEIPPFALWDQFDLDSVVQGFDETGHYYLLYQDDYDQRCFLQAVYFDRVLMKLRSNLLKIKFPDLQDESPSRTFFFDKHGAQVVHAIERYSKDNAGGIKCVDLYHLCFYNLLKTQCDHHIVIDQDQQADLSIQYADYESFSVVSFDYQCRDRGVTTLMVHAFNRLPSHDNNVTKQRVDLVHSSKGKIWHSKTILLDLKVCHLSCWSDPNLFLTRNMIYVYGKIVNKTLKVYEFDLNGQYVTSYSSPAPEDGINGLNHSSGILHYLSADENDDELKLVLKLQHGKVEAVVEWDNRAITRDFVQPDSREYFIFDGTLIRLGRIFAQYRYYKDNGLCQFRFVDLKTKETATEIDVPEDPVSYGKSNLNWNGREFSMTYYDNELLFKISRMKLKTDQITLKHFARLALLTSFSEEYLAQQKLPNSLFKYLGIDK